MIYIDLDGVCSDFNKAVITYTGTSYNGKDTWSILDKIPNLFYNLEVLPEAVESISKLLDTYGYHNIQILTALPLQTNKLVSAQVDKVTWVHEIFNHSLQVNCVPNWKYKKYFCKSASDILIDDSERNCKEWNGVGGIAILHTSWDNTLRQLK